MIRLAEMQEDARNWRPTMLVFSGNLNTRETLVSYAVWVEAGRGIVYLANVLVGELSEVAPRRPAALKQLKEFCQEKQMQVFPMVAVADSLDEGVTMLLQTTTMGPLHANVVAFGWSSDSESDQISSFVERLRTAVSLELSLVLIEDNGLPATRDPKRIDLWWRGEKNAALMMLLAHLMTENWEWSRTRVRVLRVVENEAGREPAMEALNELISGARVEASARIIVDDRPFAAILHDHSADAACVFLGVDLPEVGKEAEWHAVRSALLKGNPTTIMIHSLAGEDVLV